MKKLKPPQLEIDRLGWVIEKIKNICNPNLKKPSNNLLLFSVSTSIMRASVEIARGIYLTTKNNNREAAIILERTLYEAWCEFRDLITSNNQSEVRYLINAGKDYLDFFDKDNELRKSDEYKRINTKFSELLDRNKEVEIIISNQRNTGKYHWSGKSRTTFMKEVTGGCSSKIYKQLSWEGHTEMVAFRDYIDSDENNMKFGTTCPNFMRLEEIAYRSTIYILLIYNKFAEKFNFDIIDGQEFDKSA